MFTYNTEWYNNNQLNQLFMCTKQIELSAEKTARCLYIQLYIWRFALSHAHVH